MDKAAFVQKVKMLCLQKGVKPTNACKECGIGGSFLSDISSRGQIPSVERVQKLAAYLGVTTSELLGEDVTHSGQDHSQPDILVKFNALDSDDQEEVQAIIEMKLARKQSGK